MGTIAIDAGYPAAAIAPRLKSRFHFWAGRSSRRHVFTVYGPHEVPDFTHAVVLAVHRQGESRKILWSGISTGALGLCAMEGLYEAIAVGADEIHVHLLPDEAEACTVVVRDFSGPGWPPANYRG